MSRRPTPAPALSRRRFIARSCSVALVCVPATRLWAAPVAARSLSFVHTHTGECLTSTYYRGGRYVPAELERISYVLRDFRTGDVKAIDPEVLDILADLRVRTGGSQAFQVICGYRSAHTNALLRARSRGVAEHSMHLEGRAIDIRLPGVATTQLRDVARALGRGGVGYYAASDFVHVDNGRVRYW